MTVGRATAYRHLHEADRWRPPPLSGQLDEAEGKHAAYHPRSSMAAVGMGGTIAPEGPAAGGGSAGRSSLERRK